MRADFDLDKAIAATRGAQLMALWTDSQTVEPDDVDEALEVARGEVALLHRLRAALTNVTENSV